MHRATVVDDTRDLGCEMNRGAFEQTTGKTDRPGIHSLLKPVIAGAQMAHAISRRLAGSRVPYAMAEDGLMPKSLTKLSRTSVPVKSLVLQGIVSCILALSGSFDMLTDYVIFGSWIFYALVTSSVFVFRIKYPDIERPYRAFGYPVVPVIFLFVAGWLLINTIMINIRI